jgi:hypothetical protein
LSRGLRCGRKLKVEVKFSKATLNNDTLKFFDSKRASEMWNSYKWRQMFEPSFGQWYLPKLVEDEMRLKVAENKCAGLFKTTTPSKHLAST